MFTGQVGVLWTGCLRWKTTLEWIGSTRTSGFYSVAIVQCTSCKIPKQMNQAMLQVSIESSIWREDTERLPHRDMDRFGYDGIVFSILENIKKYYRRTTLTQQPSWHPCLPTLSLLRVSVWQKPSTLISNSLPMSLLVSMSISITLATGAVILEDETVLNFSFLSSKCLDLGDEDDIGAGMWTYQSCTEMVLKIWIADLN